MRDYAVVCPTFWTGETGRKIREKGQDAVVVALYLMTSPSSSMIGLYYLPLPTLAHETGTPLEGASKALQSLSDVDFAYYDPTTETVWVPQMAHYQIGEELSPKDNRHRGVLREVEKHAKSPFYREFFERYGEAYHLPEPKPLRSPLGAPPKPRSGSGPRTGTGPGPRGEGGTPLPPAQAEAPNEPVVLPLPRPLTVPEADALLGEVSRTAGEAFVVRTMRGTERVALARILRDRLDATTPQLLAELGRVLGDPATVRALFPTWQRVQSNGCLSVRDLLGERDDAGEHEASALVSALSAARARLRGEPLRAAVTDPGDPWNGPNLTRERLARERAAREASHG